MFRPNFDPFIGIWGIPDQNKNESLNKTECSQHVFFYDHFFVGFWIKSGSKKLFFGLT